MLRVIFITATLCILAGCGYSSTKIDEIEKKIKANNEKPLEELRQERDDLAARLEEADKELTALKSAIAEINRKLQDKEQELTKLRAALESGTKPVSVAGQNKVWGKIRAITASDNLIVVSLGEKDKITSASEMEVWRNNKLLGKIKVDSLGAEWALTHSRNMEDLNLFQVGDDVSAPVTE